MTLILAAGSAGAIETEDFSLQQSMEMSDMAFSQNYVESLFGIGGADSDLSEEWFGPQFQNTSSAYSFLSEFYISTSAPTAPGSVPVKIDINQRLPTKIYFGSGREVTYTAYQSAISAARGNELWIQKYQDWSQYAIVPQGAGMQFVAFAPAGGQAEYYEILQTDVQSITVKRVNFYPGYNGLNFLADKVGRHILLFVLNNQPSNAIIVDVISQAPMAPSATQMPPSSDMPPAYGQAGAMASGYGQTTTTTTAATTIQSPSSGSSYPTQATAAPSGDTPVTIQSQGMRGYQVYLDEVLIGIEGTAGDAPDGKFSFSVVGNQNHNIKVGFYEDQFDYQKSMYFQRGVLKIINVEPGTAVYI